jgi:transcriptional regulator with GAF, ATPase, and Fis domain
MSESPRSREHRLAETFVTLTDTLVTDFDVADLFHDLAGACVELLEVTAAGLMLVDVSGRLRVMASSSERSRLLELMEIQNDEGPCLDCHREGVPVLVADLSAQRARWPGFADEAIRVGFRAVYALPMRLRSDTIGALNLFHRDPDTITETTLRIGQALADVATIAILQQRAVHAREELSQQLQTALNSRVIIEQAKGVLAERQQTDMSTAFDLLRGHARSTNQQLSEVARAVVAGKLGTDQLAASHRPNTRPTA